MLKRLLTVNKGSKKKNGAAEELAPKHRGIIDDPFVEGDEIPEVYVVPEAVDESAAVAEASPAVLDMSFDRSNPFSEEVSAPQERDVPPLTTSQDVPVSDAFPPLWYGKRSDSMPFGDGSNKVFGFENFGNTCYCNSVLQCLYNNEEFRTSVLTYPDAPDGRVRKTEIVSRKPKTYEALLEELNDSRQNSNDSASSSTDGKAQGGNETETSFSQQSKKMLPAFMRRSNSTAISVSSGDVLNNVSAANVPVTVAADDSGNHLKLPRDTVTDIDVTTKNGRRVIVGRDLDPALSGITKRAPAYQKDADVSKSTIVEGAEYINESTPSGPTTASDPTTRESSSIPMERKKSETGNYYQLVERRKKVALVNGPVVNIDHSISDYGIKSPIYSSLKDVFEGITENNSLTGIVAPTQFIRTFRKENVLFNGILHQDAHEFLNFLLNQISDTALSETQPSGQSNFVKDLFEGSLRYRVKCLTCDNITTRDEKFLDFPIEVQGKNGTNIQNVLRQYSQREMLNGANKFYCDVCSGLQEAERMVGMKDLPNTLLLHLKRFKYSEEEQANIKLFNNIDYPAHLQMASTFDPSSTHNYSLSGLVVHLGGGPQHGHYVALCKTPKYGWLLFDDETVETVDEADVLKFSGGTESMSTAYILMYTRTDEGEGAPVAQNASLRNANVTELLKSDNAVRDKLAKGELHNGHDHASDTSSSMMSDLLGGGKPGIAKAKSGDKKSRFFSFKKKQT
ncbi:ubiquitin-specific protease [Maudiozyma humilis]|uniref:Ubiquitin carboxyl-terminal hydrolase n=1 Tax=Maudiozyma humilis TaxID=51915 RepID=A0AAV5RYS1_MAUHU|nr:ubiquitin-specific protease [Kazachstania humilis]